MHKYTYDEFGDRVQVDSLGLEQGKISGVIGKNMIVYVLMAF